MPRSSRRSGDCTISAYVGHVAHQLVVRAAADDHAVFEHEDVVGGRDRRDPLRHDHDRGVLGVRPERGAQPRVGREVEGRERVVEHVDVGPADQRAGDRQPLALPARHVGAALLDPRVEPAGHRPHEVARLRDLERGPHLLLGARRACRTARLLATVPEKRYGRCGTKPIVLHSTSGSRSCTSTPPTSTVALGAVEQPQDQVRRASTCPRRCSRRWRWSDRARSRTRRR